MPNNSSALGSPSENDHLTDRKGLHSGCESPRGDPSALGQLDGAAATMLGVVSKNGLRHPITVSSYEPLEWMAATGGRSQSLFMFRTPQLRVRTCRSKAVGSPHLLKSLGESTTVETAQAIRRTCVSHATVHPASVSATARTRAPMSMALRERTCSRHRIGAAGRPVSFLKSFGLHADDHLCRHRAFGTERHAEYTTYSTSSVEPR